jgi:hypothetical protein
VVVVVDDTNDNAPNFDNPLVKVFVLAIPLTATLAGFDLTTSIEF